LIKITERTESNFENTINSNTKMIKIDHDDSDSDNEEYRLFIVLLFLYPVYDFMFLFSFDDKEAFIKLSSFSINQLR